MKAASCALPSDPTWVATGRPFWNNISVGMLRTW
jgi:hypothetical protein